MCTLVGRASGTRWRLASNSDNPYTVKSHVVGVVDAPQPFVGAVVRCPGEEVVAWDGMVTRGVNRAGFAFTYAYVPDEAAAPEKKDEKLPAQTWSREMVATTTTTADALEFMRDRLGTILSGNYLMADTTGEAVIAEVSGHRLSLTHPRGETIACANLWQTSSDPVPPGWGGETASVERSGRSWQLLGDEAVAPAHVLTDHEGLAVDPSGRGRSICNHGVDMGTIASEVLEGSTATLWWSYGWPCGHAQGHEQVQRASWGRFLGFRVDRLRVDAELTTVDGQVTAAGVQALADGELRP